MKASKFSALIRFILVVGLFCMMMWMIASALVRAGLSTEASIQLGVIVLPLVLVAFGIIMYIAVYKALEAASASLTIPIWLNTSILPDAPAVKEADNPVTEEVSEASAPSVGEPDNEATPEESEGTATVS